MKPLIDYVSIRIKMLNCHAGIGHKCGDLKRPGTANLPCVVLTDFRCWGAGQRCPELLGQRDPVDVDKKQYPGGGDASQIASGISVHAV